MTKARVTLTFLLLLFSASLLFAVQSLFITGPSRSLGVSSLLSVAVIGGLLSLHLRGWAYSHIALVVGVSLLVVLSVNASLIRQQVIVSILVPTVIASIVLTPRWILPLFFAMLGGLVLRVLLDGGQLTFEALGPTFSITSGLILCITAIGITLASMVSREAQQVAEVNERAANASRGQIQEQARALEREVALAQAARADTEAARLALAEQLATIQAQRAVIQDMSVPVLPIMPRALLMPLVGALDTMRLQMAQERALAMIEQQAARYLLLDISGVPLIDSEVAGGLLRLVQAAGLLGAQVVVVGIRPEVAQSMIGLGLAFNVTTRSTLQEGIGYILGATASSPRLVDAR